MHGLSSDAFTRYFKVGGLLADGVPADPALWPDWEEAVASVLAAERSGRGYSEADFRVS